MREVGIPEVWHFLYKSRSTTQLTSPDYTAPYSKSEERARLFAVYQSIHDRMHNAARPLKTLFLVGKFEAVLGWVRIHVMCYDAAETAVDCRLIAIGYQSTVNEGKFEVPSHEHRLWM